MSKGRDPLERSYVNIRGIKAERICLQCGDKFWSRSVGNRICGACKPKQASIRQLETADRRR